MNISAFNSSYSSVYSMFDNMYQNSLSMFNYKLGNSLLPANNKQKTDLLSSSSLQYVTNIKQGANKLSFAIKGLSSGASFMKKTMTSSDKDVLSVNYVGSIFNRPETTTVKIDRLATGQVNEGKQMKAGEAFGDSGDKFFKLEVDGKTTVLSVKVAAGDTNEQVQKKMAEAVNNAGVGVKASVETDSAEKTSMLKLEATGTVGAAKSKFKISDMIGGDLVQKTGVDKITKEAQSAVYSVNGGPSRTSATNTVDLGNGINVTFNKTSDKEVTISQGMDTDYAKNAVKDLVAGYNDIYVEALKNSSDPKAEGLAMKMLNTSKLYLSSLSSIGVGFDKDGKMTIDDEQFSKAADNGKLEKFFMDNSGRNFGFTYQLGKIADDVTRNTSKYVTKSIFGNNLMENFSYSGTGSLQSYNYTNTGWLFDYMT